MKQKLCYKDFQNKNGDDRRVAKTVKCYNCTCCNDIYTGDATFTHPITNETFTMRTITACNEERVVYLATCVCCTSFYVGKTIRKLRERMVEHRSEIRRKLPTNALSKHILDEGVGHTFRFRVLCKVEVGLRKGDINNLLELTELEWIIRLQANVAPGLNNSVSLKPVLAKRQREVL